MILGNPRIDSTAVPFLPEANYYLALQRTTTWTILLSIAYAEAKSQPKANGRKPTSQHITVTLTLPQKKILVADDELDIRNLTKIILEKNGYQVSLAANDAETLQKAENELPDLILLDASIGWEVCKTLRSQERTKHIPIVSTALSIPLDKNSKSYAQVDGHIPKPFNTEELLSEVRKQINIQRR